MRLNLPEVSVEKEGITTEISMGIDSTNQHIIMNMLRSGIYSNPLESAVREIISNAVDANVAAGKESSPIEIQLPNAFSSNLSVRDYGNSMSPDEIKNVYAMLGSSSKRDSDTQIGCYGIGAVSPLSYTDSFTIETNTREGEITVKRIWVEYVDESLMGKLSLISEEITEEATGTKVSIPIKSADNSALRAAVNKYCRYLPTTPIVDGGPLFIPDLQIYLEGEGWKWYLETGVFYISNGSSDKAQVVMGGVPYPISTKEMPDLDKRCELLCKFSVAIFLPIGAVTLTANRENLQYTDKTVSTIKGILAKICDQANKAQTDSIEVYDDLYTVSTQYHRLDNSIKMILGSLLWKGIKVSSSYPVPEGYRCQLFYKNVAWNGNSYVPKLVADKVSSIEAGRDNIKIILNDLGTKTANRELIEKLFTTINDGKKYQFYVFSLSEPKEIPKDDLHYYKIERLSTLFPQFVPSPSKRVKGMIEGYRFNPKMLRSHTSGAYVYFTPVKVDRNGEGVYAELHDGTCYVAHRMKINGNLDRIGTLLKMLGVEQQDLIGVKRALIEKLSPNWRSVQNLIDKKVEEINDLEDIIPDIRDADFIFRRAYAKIDKLADQLPNMRADSVARRYIEYSNKLNNFLTKKGDEILLIVNCSKFQSNKEQSKIKSLYESFSQTYPMLTLLRNAGVYFSSHDYPNTLVEYLKLVDDKA